MIRTRFAPSPTGYLHIGGLRTALYSYLYAKQNNGEFILRIEDTDQSRCNDMYMKDIIDTLNLFKIYPDAMFIQSNRLELYREKVNQLIDTGHAYKVYNDDGTFAVKLSLHKDDNSIITYKDRLRGNVSWNVNELYDIVLLKSDGYPTYHLASVVDDHDMEITHVFRGEEWLSSTPYHVELYKSFGWDIPEFIHLGLILNEDGKKLSKRDGDFSVQSLLNNNYIPSAIINYISLLGWHPSGNSEIFTLDQLLEVFNISRIKKSACCYDKKKLRKFNLIHGRTDYGKCEFYEMSNIKSLVITDRHYDLFKAGIDIPNIRVARVPINDHYLYKFIKHVANIVLDHICKMDSFLDFIPNDIINNIVYDISLLYTKKELNENLRLLLTDNINGIPIDVLLGLCDKNKLISIFTFYKNL